MDLDSKVPININQAMVQGQGTHGKLSFGATLDNTVVMRRMTSTLNHQNGELSK